MPDITPSVDEPATARTPDRCSKCGGRCMVRDRAQTPPANLIDFFDRQITMIATGHWSRSTLGVFAGVLASLTVAIAVTMITLATALNPLAASALGGASAAGLAVWIANKVRRRLQ